jgi:hypothetical protein
MVCGGWDFVVAEIIAVKLQVIAEQDIPVQCAAAWQR